MSEQKVYTLTAESSNPYIMHAAFISTCHHPTVMIENNYDEFEFFVSFCVGAEGRADGGYKAEDLS